MSRPTSDDLATARADPVRQLEQEWPALAAGPLARRLPSWGARHAPLGRFGGPSEIIPFLRNPGPMQAKSDVLAALLEVACREPLAGRVVVEALLPGLKAIAKPLLREVERDELWSLLLATLWEQIVAYPPERPRRAVALYLLRNTHRSTVRLLARERRRAQQPPLLPHPPPPARACDIDAVLAAAVSAGVISQAEGELIAASRIDRTRLTTLACQLAVGYDALRMRRARAERRLVRFLAADDVRNGAGGGPFTNVRVPARGTRRDPTVAHLAGALPAVVLDAGKE